MQYVGLVVATVMAIAAAIGCGGGDAPDDDHRPPVSSSHLSAVTVLALPSAEARKRVNAIARGGSSWGDRNDRIREIVSLGSPIETFKEDPSYLAFMVAYLMDEGLVPERDWDLREALFELAGHRPTDVIPGEENGIDVQALARVNMNEVVDEFFAGGQGDSAKAREGLEEALGIVRRGLAKVGSGGVLVLWM